MDLTEVKQFEGQVVDMWSLICNRAADLVERGHCKGMQAQALDGRDLGADVMHPDATRFCLMGALRRAGAEQGLGARAPRVWMSRMGRQFCALYNNAPERTAAEVVGLLRANAGLRLL